MIAAPSPSPAPAWVNDHRHAGHKRTYFARFPEKRVSLWGCSLCAGSALPAGSCEQPLLPAGDGLRLTGLRLAGLHQPRPRQASARALPRPRRAAPSVAAAREKAARTMRCSAASSGMLRPRRSLQLLKEDGPGAVPGARRPGATGAGAAGARVRSWNPRTALPGSAAAGPAPACHVSQWIGHSLSPALWKAFGRGPQQAGLLLALSGN